MKAFHSIWSKPKGEFSPEAFEILSAVLSSLQWQKTNGEICMVCDTLVADFLYSTGLFKVWNEIKVTLDKIPDSINPKTYWAAGKIFALSEFPAPIVGIDTDFLVWKKLSFNNPISVIHTEELDPSCYPDLDDFTDFADGFDFLEKASNTAFFYINDNEFLEFYTKKSIEFMKKYNPNENSLPHMLFAEQRLFSMCAKKLSKRINEFSSLSELFSDKNETFTHLWGYKDILRKNPELKKSFCEKTIHRINSDFPEYSPLLKNLIY